MSRPLQRRRPNGIALVSAVFLVVVVALLAAFAVSIGNLSRQAVALETLATRVSFAARSGMQRAIHAVLSAGSCFASPAAFTLSGGASDGVELVLECTATPVSEGPDSYTVYRLTVTASRGSFGQVDYVTRTLTATVTDAP